MTWTDTLGILAILLGLPSLWLCWREIIVKHWLPSRSTDHTSSPEAGAKDPRKP